MENAKEKNREFSAEESGVYVVRYEGYGTIVEDVARWSALGQGFGFWEFFGDEEWAYNFEDCEIVKKIY